MPSIGITITTAAIVSRTIAVNSKNHAVMSCKWWKTATAMAMTIVIIIAVTILILKARTLAPTMLTPSTDNDDHNHQDGNHSIDDNSTSNEESCLSARELHPDSSDWPALSYDEMGSSRASSENI